MGAPAIQCDRIWYNARLYTSATPNDDGFSIIACRDGRIIYAGAMDGAPEFDAPEQIDCGSRWITPGLIDCHTHLVYGGNRANEFARRLEGVSYQELARAGGGILSTMRATRDASEAELLRTALLRLDRLIAEGVTTIEVKSGYGLSLVDEVKCLSVARQLANERSVSVSATLLGAHALPPEYNGRAEDYIDLVCKQMIPLVAAQGLADAVDGFCETIGFSREQVERVFVAAQAHGLRVKLHADQLSNGHGAQLAGQYSALSADHLEFADAEGIEAMRAAGTVAVLLPGAYYFTRETKLPPIDNLRRAGVPIAIATDSNPGTSPLTSLLLAMNMAATLFRLTVDECLVGVTREAAKALGILQETGTLEIGKWCDLAIWDVDHPAELVYQISGNPLHNRVRRGR
jgi:imidazolonepropionase